MKIRNVGKMNRINDAAHSRSLVGSLMMPALISALQAWVKAGHVGVLIGTAALGFHVRPRMTQDLEFLFPDAAAIPETVSGFDRVGLMLLRHRKTGVEVILVTPAAIQVPPEVAEEVARTAMSSDGVQVASESGLVGLKLFRRSRQHEADIVALIKTGRVDLTGFPLAPEQRTVFRKLVEAAATELHPP